MAAGNQDSTAVRRLSLRHKERKSYADIIDIDDEEIYGKRNYSLHEKLTSTDVYTTRHVKEMRAADVTLKYFQENGFSYPILVRKKEGLGIRLPNSDFSVNDVKQCVGSRRQVDVMNVKTQRGEELSMKEWTKYYESEERDRLLNVISLEFSHTSLDNYVEQPDVVKQMDWVDLAWPQYLRASQTDGTNQLDHMKYPKVQRYCLMSVAGCYTDFHIDMGGTSVWYHILRGKKVFWLVPPTEENLRKYENWTLTAKQGDVFFPDLVTDCQRVILDPGVTFFIPSGWIHGVYTPVDSLVFGGNFLHSFGIAMQLRIWDAEIKTRVPQKFRFPFFAAMHWYVLARYVSCLLGKHHRVKSDEELAVEARLQRKRGPRKKKGEDTNGVSSNGLHPETDEQETDGGSVDEDENDDKETGAVSDDELDGKYSTHVNGSSSLKVKDSTQSPLKQALPGGRNGGLRERALNSRASTKIEHVNGSRKMAALNKDTNCSIVSHSSTRSTRQQSEQASDKTVCVVKREALKPNSSIDRTEAIVKRNNETLDGDKAANKNIKGESSYTHLTLSEIDGLKKIVVWLRNLPENKRGVPSDILDPDALLADVEILISKHQYDDPYLCASGKPSIVWSSDDAPRTALQQPRAVVKPLPASHPSSAPPSKPHITWQQKGSKTSLGGPKPRVGYRHRRVRCRKCAPCQSDDCGLCINCRDMVKFGGPGTKKQSCLARQCMSPLLPAVATCRVCGKVKASDNTGREKDDLMECHVCFKITHMACVGAPGVINEDLRNSWACPACSGTGQPAADDQKTEANGILVNDEPGNGSSWPLNGYHMETANGLTQKRILGAAAEADSQLLLAKKHKSSSVSRDFSLPGWGRLTPGLMAATSASGGIAELVLRTSRGREVQTPARFRNVFDMFES